MDKSVEFTSKLKGKVYNINIRLRTRITIITDLSGTGKTLFRKMAMKDCSRVVGYGSSDINNLKAQLSNGRFNFEDRIVIIDNAEKLMYEIPELVRVVNCDMKNFYILFLRQSSLPISATPNSQAKIIFNTETNTFTIQYDYEDGVWS